MRRVVMFSVLSLSAVYASGCTLDFNSFLRGDPGDVVNPQDDGVPPNDDGVLPMDDVPQPPQEAPVTLCADRPTEGLPTRVRVMNTTLTGKRACVSAPGSNQRVELIPGGTSSTQGAPATTVFAAPAEVSLTGVVQFTIVSESSNCNVTPSNVLLQSDPVVMTPGALYTLVISPSGTSDVNVQLFREADCTNASGTLVRAINALGGSDSPGWGASASATPQRPWGMVTADFTGLSNANERGYVAMNAGEVVPFWGTAPSRRGSNTFLLRDRERVSWLFVQSPSVSSGMRTYMCREAELQGQGYLSCPMVSMF